MVLPTPHEEEYDGSRPTSLLPPKDFGYAQLSECLQEVANIVKPDQTLCIVSTVLPGTIRRLFAPLCPGVRLLYTPSFMAMGCVDHDLHNPEFYLAGSECQLDSDFSTIRTFFQSINSSASIVTATWEEAECVKVFYNTFISFKLSLVNMIQDVSMRLGNVDVDRVTNALSQSNRRLLSTQYLKAGMGDGGPCHPRDNVALRSLAERLDLGYDLFGAICASRDMQAKHLASFLAGFGLPVLITSKAYKPSVPYTDGSYSLLVASWVRELGIQVEFLDDLDSIPSDPRTVLLSHELQCSKFEFPLGSIIVDPWRRFASDQHRVVHYGNTRNMVPLQNHMGGIP
ncbi:MAG: hypothetical protein Q7U97_12505 [Rhodocyclaceae bacterium]|nr:hypothetical protein [Rhodocyclaceae bacterium]